MKALLSILALLIFGMASAEAGKFDFADGRFQTRFRENCGVLTVTNGQIQRYEFGACGRQPKRKDIRSARFNPATNMITMGAARLRVEAVGPNRISGTWSYKGFTGPQTFALIR